MSSDKARRSKDLGRFDIVVIPAGEGGASKSFSFTRRKLWFLIVGGMLALFLVSLAGLIYTPLALIVPLPNSVLEEKYGRQLLATQRELKALGQEVIRLGEYNKHLRTILGDSVPDTARTVFEPDEYLNETDTDESSVAGPGTFEGEYTEPPPDYRPVSLLAEAGSFHLTKLPFVNPVAGIVSQGFNAERGHFGIDFASKLGTPVFAAAAGYVVFSGWTHDGGNMVMISHDNGYMTVYKHNQSLLVTAHTMVNRGDVIALLGSSGSSTGPHLHFEIWRNGMPVDPEEFLLQAVSG